MVGANDSRSRVSGTRADGGPSARHPRREATTSPFVKSGAVGRLAWWCLAALLLGAFAFELHGLLEARRINAVLARNDLTFIAESDTVRGQFARAFRLHASGKLHEAVAAYGGIALEREPELRAIQLFNLANLYLAQAVELERAEELQSAMSLVELAKQNYREILVSNPRHWDARYNLSRALEMLPDVPAVDYENERNPERSPRAPQAARTYEGLP